MGDAGPAPEGAMTDTGFWRRLRADAGALRNWVSAQLRGWRHGRAVGDAQGGLEQARRALGSATLELDEPPASGGLEEARDAVAALEDARAALAAAQEEHRRAREDLEAADRATREQVDAAKARIDEAQASWEEASDRLEAAQDELRRLQEAEEAKGPPPIGRHPKPNAELAAARGRVEELRAPAEARRSELALGKEARRELEAARSEARVPLKQARAEAAKRVEQTEDTVQAKAALADDTLLTLGAAVQQDAPSAPALAAPLAAVQRAAGLVGDRQAARKAARARARAAAPGAWRFGWKLGAVLLGGVILLVLVTGGDDAARDEAAPQTAARTPDQQRPPETRPPTTRQPTKRPQAAAAPPRDEPPPEAEPQLTPAAAAAVLALPEVATERDGNLVRQEAQGAPQVLGVQPAPGGARRLRVRVDVLRRDAAGDPGVSYGVLVDVLVGREGRPLQVRSVGEVDPEFEALFEDD